MLQLHKHLHHAKKRIKHPEIKGFFILAILTLSLPILVFAIAQKTQLKQQASVTNGNGSTGGGIAPGSAQPAQTQCELNGDVCEPVGYPCTNGQQSLPQFSCNSGYRCCRPGVSFPTSNPGYTTSGNQCGNCKGQICANPGQYCEESLGGNWFDIYLCNQTNGVWQFQYKQNGSPACPNTGPATGGTGNTGGGSNPSDLCTSYASSDNWTCGTAIHGNPDTLYQCVTKNGVRQTSTTKSCGGTGCTQCAPGKDDVCGNNCNGSPNSNPSSGLAPNAACTVQGVSGTCQTTNNCKAPSSSIITVNSPCASGLVCCPNTTPPPPENCSCDNPGDGTPKNHYTCLGDPSKSNFCKSNEICNGPKGGSSLVMCSKPTTPVCTCEHTGVHLPGLNGYFCTNSNTHYYCGQWGFFDNAQGKHGLEVCTNETSTWPANPCLYKGYVPGATSNSVTVYGNLQGNVKPDAQVNVQIDLINKSSVTSMNGLLATSKVLSAQIIRTTDTLTFDSANNQYINWDYNFKNVPPGDYLMFIKVDKYLAAQLTDLKGNTTITFGPDKQVQLAAFSLTPGDISPSTHGDNFIDANDYNDLLTCFGKAPTGNCKLSDLNNDGKIDNEDYQMLIGNFGKFGDSFEEPNFTCTNDPNCQTGNGSIQMCALKCTKNIDF